MPDVRDVFYEGIRQQVKRVVNLLGPERTEKGLEAFENGSSTWSHCFFAQALAPQRLHSELDVCEALGLTSETTKSGYNIVPVRIVYYTFDQVSSMITKNQLRDMMRDMIEEDDAVKTLDKSTASLDKAKEWLAKKASQLNILKKIDYTGVAEKPISLDGPSCA